jgi:polyisoprenyl-phosphate glycosyltransferase
MIDVSLIIPIWNEESNIQSLIEIISTSDIFECGINQVIFVENGSTDSSKELLRLYQNTYWWIDILELENNAGYGGGILEGIKSSKNDYVCYIPGDMQILPSAVSEALMLLQSCLENPTQFVIKGNRITRDDTLQTQFISKVFSKITSIFLHLDVRDVNGLPKLFNRRVILDQEINFETNFVFDAQILTLAKFFGCKVIEFPVHFYARREGVSSWGTKRLQTYAKIASQLVKLRFRYYVVKPFKTLKQ